MTHENLDIKSVQFKQNIASLPQASVDHQSKKQKEERVCCESTGVCTWLKLRIKADVIMVRTIMIMSSHQVT